MTNTNTERKPTKWIAYYRVSTQRQGQSGLGLEAQQASVEQHVAQHGGELIASFTEVESGKRMRNRPELQRALEMAKPRRACLIIARLDRLARNLHTITTLIESGIDFVAVDNPYATKLTIQILGAVAESERDLASLRTSEAMRAAKARGVRIGESARVLAAKYKREALEHAARYVAPLREAREAGATTVRAVRDWFNSQGIPSPGGARWHLPNTHRMIKRVRILEERIDDDGPQRDSNGRESEQSDTPAQETLSGGTSLRD